MMDGLRGRLEYRPPERMFINTFSINAISLSCAL